MSLPLVAAAFGLLFHFGGKEVRRFEHLAAEDLSSRLEGAAKHVDVKVKLGSLRLGHLSKAIISAGDFSSKTLPLWTEANRSKQGIIDHLQIRLRNFKLGGLPVQSMEIELDRCRWDVAYAMREGRIRLSKSGTGRFSAVITSQGVSQFLVSRYPQLKPESLIIDPYKVSALIGVPTPLGRIQIDMIATAKIWKGTGVALFPAYLAFDGKTVRPDNMKSAAELFQPALDLNRDFGLRGALEIDRLELGDGLIRIEGKASIPEIPAEQSVLPRS